MKITALDAIKLKANDKFKVKECPNCGYSGDKILSDNVYNLPSFDIGTDGKIGLEHIDAMPAIMTTCPECGYISFFNMKVICE